ncbi:hypothetical protein CBR_g37341 [Chara braunii]|uniref:Uncharacterized protein n=1 Tax=Chara braunii TaxID=69332 RepID=A0A388JZR3_CHABU|nr:hypothetical protein CBR_g37341 [Chara braunii]|eukprot:GBG63255.1 hypothetical protein CBR_g37341 [Chara braunii]
MDSEGWWRTTKRWGASQVMKVVTPRGHSMERVSPGMGEANGLSMPNGPSVGRGMSPAGWPADELSMPGRGPGDFVQDKEGPTPAEAGDAEVAGQGAKDWGVNCPALGHDGEPVDDADAVEGEGLLESGRGGVNGGEGGFEGGQRLEDSREFRGGGARSWLIACKFAGNAVDGVGTKIRHVDGKIGPWWGKRGWMTWPEKVQAVAADVIAAAAAAMAAMLTTTRWEVLVWRPGEVNAEFLMKMVKATHIVTDGSMNMDEVLGLCYALSAMKKAGSLMRDESEKTENDNTCQGKSFWEVRANFRERRVVNDLLSAGGIKALQAAATLWKILGKKAGKTGSERWSKRMGDAEKLAVVDMVISAGAVGLKIADAMIDKFWWKLGCRTERLGSVAGGLSKSDNLWEVELLGRLVVLGGELALGMGEELRDLVTEHSGVSVNSLEFVGSNGEEKRLAVLMGSLTGVAGKEGLVTACHLIGLEAMKRKTAMAGGMTSAWTDLNGYVSMIEELSLLTCLEELGGKRARYIGGSLLLLESLGETGGGGREGAGGTRGEAVEGRGKGGKAGGSGADESENILLAEIFELCGFAGLQIGVHLLGLGKRRLSEKSSHKVNCEEQIRGWSALNSGGEGLNRMTRETSREESPMSQCQKLAGVQEGGHEEPPASQGQKVAGGEEGNEDVENLKAKCVEGMAMAVNHPIMPVDIAHPSKAWNQLDVHRAGYAAMDGAAESLHSSKEETGSLFSSAPSWSSLEVEDKKSNLQSRVQEEEEGDQRSDVECVTCLRCNMHRHTETNNSITISRAMASGERKSRGSTAPKESPCKSLMQKLVALKEKGCEGDVLRTILTCKGRDVDALKKSNWLMTDFILRWALHQRWENLRSLLGHGGVVARSVHGGSSDKLRVTYIILQKLDRLRRRQIGKLLTLLWREHGVTCVSEQIGTGNHHLTARIIYRRGMSTSSEVREKTDEEVEAAAGERDIEDDDSDVGEGEDGEEENGVLQRIVGERIVLRFHGEKAEMGAAWFSSKFKELGRWDYGPDIVFDVHLAVKGGGRSGSSPEDAISCMVNMANRLRLTAEEVVVFADTTMDSDRHSPIHITINPITHRGGEVLPIEYRAATAAPAAYAHSAPTHLLGATCNGSVWDWQNWIWAVASMVFSCFRGGDCCAEVFTNMKAVMVDLVSHAILVCTVGMVVLLVLALWLLSVLVIASSHIPSRHENGSFEGSEGFQMCATEYGNEEDTRVEEEGSCHSLPLCSGPFLMDDEETEVHGADLEDNEKEHDVQLQDGRYYFEFVHRLSPPRVGTQEESALWSQRNKGNVTISEEASRGLRIGGIPLGVGVCMVGERRNAPDVRKVPCQVPVPASLHGDQQRSVGLSSSLGMEGCKHICDGMVCDVDPWFPSPDAPTEVAAVACDRRDPQEHLCKEDHRSISAVDERRVFSGIADSWSQTPVGSADLHDLENYVMLSENDATTRVAGECNTSQGERNMLTAQGGKNSSGSDNIQAVPVEEGRRNSTAKDHFVSHPPVHATGSRGKAILSVSDDNPSSSGSIVSSFDPLLTEDVHQNHNYLHHHQASSDNEEQRLTSLPDKWTISESSSLIQGDIMTLGCHLQQQTQEVDKTGEPVTKAQTHAIIHGIEHLVEMSRTGVKHPLPLTVVDGEVKVPIAREGLITFDEIDSNVIVDIRKEKTRTELSLVLHKDTDVRSQNAEHNLHVSEVRAWQGHDQLLAAVQVQTEEARGGVGGRVSHGKPRVDISHLNNILAGSIAALILINRWTWMTETTDAEAVIDAKQESGCRIAAATEKVVQIGTRVILQRIETGGVPVIGGGGGGGCKETEVVQKGGDAVVGGEESHGGGYDIPEISSLAKRNVEVGLDLERGMAAGKKLLEEESVDAWELDTIPCNLTDLILCSTGANQPDFYELKGWDFREDNKPSSSYSVPERSCMESETEEPKVLEGMDMGRAQDLKSLVLYPIGAAQPDGNVPLNLEESEGSIDSFPWNPETEGSCVDSKIEALQWLGRMDMDRVQVSTERLPSDVDLSGDFSETSTSTFGAISSDCFESNLNNLGSQLPHQGSRVIDMAGEQSGTTAAEIGFFGVGVQTEPEYDVLHGAEASNRWLQRESNYIAHKVRRKKDRHGDLCAAVLCNDEATTSELERRSHPSTTASLLSVTASSATSDQELFEGSASASQDPYDSSASSTASTQEVFESFPEHSDVMEDRGRVSMVAPSEENGDKDEQDKSGAIHSSQRNRGEENRDAENTQYKVTSLSKAYGISSCQRMRRVHYRSQDSIESDEPSSNRGGEISSLMANTICWVEQDKVLLESLLYGGEPGCQLAKKLCRHELHNEEVDFDLTAMHGIEEIYECSTDYSSRGQEGDEDKYKHEGRREELGCSSSGEVRDWWKRDLEWGNKDNCEKPRSEERGEGRGMVMEAKERIRVVEQGGNKSDNESRDGDGDENEGDDDVYEEERSENEMLEKAKHKISDDVADDVSDANELNPHANHAIEEGDTNHTGDADSTFAATSPADSGDNNDTDEHEISDAASHDVIDVNELDVYPNHAIDDGDTNMAGDADAAFAATAGYDDDDDDDNDDDSNNSHNTNDDDDDDDDDEDDEDDGHDDDNVGMHYSINDETTSHVSVHSEGMLGELSAYSSCSTASESEAGMTSASSDSSTCHCTSAGGSESGSFSCLEEDERSNTTKWMPSYCRDSRKIPFHEVIYRSNACPSVSMSEAGTSTLSEWNPVNEYWVHDELEHDVCNHRFEEDKTGQPDVVAWKVEGSMNRKYRGQNTCLFGEGDLVKQYYKMKEKQVITSKVLCVAEDEGMDKGLVVTAKRKSKRKTEDVHGWKESTTVAVPVWCKDDNCMTTYAARVQVTDRVSEKVVKFWGKAEGEDGREARDCLMVEKTTKVVRVTRVGLGVESIPEGM